MTPIRSLKYNAQSSSNILHNPRFQFAQKHALCLYRQNAVYSFIPKNGCTTLRASLAINNGLLAETDVQNNINWIHNNTYTFSASLRELITTDYSFTILRCPYSRLVSLFLDKFVDKTPIAWNFYRSSNNRFDVDKLTFSDFISYLYENPHYIAADIHWRRQSDFLIYNHYDDYFDFCEFKNITSTLKSKLNLKIFDTRSYTFHGRDIYNEIDSGSFSDTPVHQLKDLKINGSVPSVQAMIDKQLQSKILSIYRKDFELRKSVNLKLLSI